MATQSWSYPGASAVTITPYLSHSPCNTYKNVAIYMELKGVPLAIKLTTTHIFISYLPPEDKEAIQNLVQEGTNLIPFDIYYFEYLLNIPRTKPYKNLACMNMECRKRFSISLSKNGYQDLTNPEIFHLLFSLWQHFYHPNNSYSIKTPINYFDMSVLQQTNHKDLVLFNDNYDMKQMEYMFIYEYLNKISFAPSSTPPPAPLQTQI